MDIPILYEDNHLLVVQKPCNMPVQADSSHDEDLLTHLKAYIKQAYQKPGAVYLGLVHRLDRPTGGVMVFARTSKAAARLSQQVRDGLLGKEYLCLCHGRPGPGDLEDHLLKDAAHNMVRAVPQGTPGAKYARLTLQPLHTQGGNTLCRVTLHTGRSHQIRVQLGSRGYPLLGDRRYNPAARPGQQLALWAWQLTLQHPTRGEEMTFTALPRGGLWAPYGAQIAALAQPMQPGRED